MHAALGRDYEPQNTAKKQMTMRRAADRTSARLEAAAADSSRAFDTPLLRWETIFLVMLFASATLLRLWAVSKVHYWDEMVYLQNAEVICCGKNNYSELVFRPPLISLLFAAIFLFWHSIFAACILTAIMNALAPVFLYFAGRIIVGRRAALMASLFLGLGPFFVGVFPPGFDSDFTGNSLLTDSPALTLIALSLWLLAEAVRWGSSLRYLLGGIALSLCVLMRFGSLPCVGLLLTLPVFSSRRIRAFGTCVTGFVCGIAPYLAWSRWRFGEFFYTIREGWVHVEGPTPPFTFYLQHALTIFTPVAVIGLAIALFFQLADVRDGGPGEAFAERLRLYLWGWLVIGFLAYGLIPHKEPRYILPAATPFLLLAGWGWSRGLAVPRGSVRAVAVAGLCVLMFVSFFPLRARLAQPLIDWRVPDEEVAAKMLSATVPPDTVLYMSYDYPALAYYTNYRIHELSTFGAALYREMDEVPSGEVLVVYREAEEPAQSDVAWCDANRHFVRLAEYPTFVVYRRL